MSGWPSGLRRQTQGYPCSPVGNNQENSGPRMRAWVQIPLLTKLFVRVKYFYDGIGILFLSSDSIEGSVAERSKALV